MLPALFLISAVGCSDASDEAGKPPSAGGLIEAQAGHSAVDVHAQTIVIDMHNNVTVRMIDEDGFDLALSNQGGHTDLSRMSAGGLDAQFMSVWVDPSEFPGELCRDRALAMIEVIEDFVARNPDRVKLASDAAEIRAIAERSGGSGS